MNLVERNLSRTARRKMAQRAKKTAKKRAIKRKARAKRMKTRGQLTSAAEKLAKNILVKKMTGGKKYGQLSIGQKEMVDKKLAKKPGLIKKLEIDTHHFKGNYPDTCSIQTASITKDLSNKSIVNNSKNWKFILNKSKLSAHKKHVFKKFLIKRTKENYLRINIYPDGGISRIRAFGNFVK